jgi:hypothetical protein
MKNNIRIKSISSVLSIMFALGAAPAMAADDYGKPKMSPNAVIVDHNADIFSPDPTYKNEPYDAEAQRKIYGGKRAIDEARPLLELGRSIYQEGPYRAGSTHIGEKNILDPSLAVYGEWRTAVAFNNNQFNEKALVATRLDLEVDLKLTATERLHAQFLPFVQADRATRYEFGGGDRKQGDLIVDGNLQTLFFEGDVGSIVSGITDKYASYDLPIAGGFMPLLFQNGVWFDDEIIGGAISIPSLNSPALDITNMDITFFGGFDKVTTPAIKDAQGNLADHGVSLVGITTFIEANQGYWEAGFGRIIGEGGFSNNSYNSATLAFSKRYGGWLSNSTRVGWTFGQQEGPGGRQQTADGVILLSENSLITSLPSTLVPYFNAWIGLDRPQPLADDTGLLKNTGLNFETDNLTGFPKLDDTGHNTFGAALGIQYLFNLDQQIVVEVASVQAIGGANELGRAARNDQYGFQIRYQRPITNAWIVRADAMYGVLKDLDDLTGVRFEVRRKF